MDKEGSSPARRSRDLGRIPGLWSGRWIPGRWVSGRWIAGHWFWVAGYQVAGFGSLDTRSLDTRSQVPGRWLSDQRPARAEFGSLHQDESCAIFLGKESLTSKHFFWKGSC
ncbi:UNVERIFIED_CONTAM: hypothetical protein Slati_0164800 [Sesamum latifolium]|uniref:Uncharacterized protein n=1 Tax=Sesamum latifolium TaxID=2727402 RepID=A0AAW2YBE8_9LAMI